MAAGISQRARTLAKSYNDIMKIKDDKAKIAQFDEIFLKGSLGTTYDAVFFSYRNGTRITNNEVRGYFSPVLEPHMPHITMFVSNELEVAALRRKTRKGELPDPSVSHPESRRDAAEWSEILKDAEARAIKVKAYIGFAALKKHRYVPIPNFAEFKKKNAAIAKRLSEEMKGEVKRLLDAGSHPVYYEIYFDPALVAQDKIFLGCPAWAQNFADAIKQGVICCIIDGSGETGRRIHIIGEIMDHEKNYGARVKQLWVSQPDSRQVVINRHRIRTTPFFEHVSNDNYHYRPQLPSYDWTEASIKMAVTIRQKRVVVEQQKSEFEKEKHNIIFLNIPGAHEGHLFGFIDFPRNDSTLLTPDTELRMTFCDDEKAAEAKPGKENRKDITDDDSDVEEKDVGGHGKSQSTSVGEGHSSTIAQDDETDRTTEQPHPALGQSQYQSQTEETSTASSLTQDEAPTQTLGLIPAESLYLEDFPYGAGILETSAENLKCGLHALCESWEKQRSEIPPTVAELENIVTSEAYQATMVPGLDNTNDFYADQLAIIINMWSSTLIQLCIIVEGDDTPYILHAENTNASRLWIHLAPTHWQGLEPLTAEEQAADAVDPDQDVKLLVQSLRDKMEANSFWKCRVSPPVPNGPANLIPVFVTKPWNKEKKCFDRRPLRIVYTRVAAEYDLKRVVQGAVPHAAQFKIVDSARQSTQNMVALDLLNFEPKNKPWTELNKMWRQILTFNNLHQIPDKDMFDSVRGRCPRPEEFMQLNTQQAQGIAAAATAKGGIMLVEGYPGAGKSHFICQFLKPFLMSEHPGPILLTANSNGAVDSLLQKAWSVYKDLVYQGNAKPGKLFIRLYSNTSEKAIRSRHVKATMEKDPNARPEVDEVNIAQMGNLDGVIRKLFDDSRTHTFPGIFDRRVKDLTFALGEALLSRTGLIHDPLYTPDHAKETYADFRMQFKRYYTTKDMTTEQRKKYVERERDLLIQILSEADVVACTVYMSGSKLIEDALAQKKLIGICIDEAPHEELENLLPIFSLRAPNVKWTIFSGDSKQLAPPQLYTPKEVTFVREQGLPLPTRLQLLGWPVVKLTDQSRMVPEISNIVNRLAYSDEITNVMSRCSLDVRQYAREFRKFAQTQWKKAQNVVWLDAQGPVTGTNKCGSSKSNQFFAITALNLVPKLLRLGKSVTVALLTPYAAQRNLYLGAFASMQFDSYMKDFDLANNLFVGTIDSVIGKEYTYVILDLPTDKIPGFLSDVRRLNVGLSRARDGLIVIMNGKDVTRMNGRSSFHLKNLVKLLMEHQVELKPLTLPACRWYTPEA